MYEYTTKVVGAIDPGCSLSLTYRIFHGTLHVFGLKFSSMVNNVILSAVIQRNYVPDVWGSSPFIWLAWRIASTQAVSIP